ncbi:MAG: hypothetical protein AAGF07_01805 [Patescibacteria group bacterium]
MYLDSSTSEFYFSKNKKLESQISPEVIEVYSEVKRIYSELLDDYSYSPRELISALKKYVNSNKMLTAAYTSGLYAIQFSSRRGGLPESPKSRTTLRSVKNSLFLLKDFRSKLSAKRVAVEEDTSQLKNEAIDNFEGNKPNKFLQIAMPKPDEALRDYLNSLDESSHTSTASSSQASTSSVRESYQPQSLAKTNQPKASSFQDKLKSLLGTVDQKVKSLLQGVKDGVIDSTRSIPSHYKTLRKSFGNRFDQLKNAAESIKKVPSQVGSWYSQADLKQKTAVSLAAGIGIYSTSVPIINKIGSQVTGRSFHAPTEVIQGISNTTKDIHDYLNRDQIARTEARAELTSIYEEYLDELEINTVKANKHKLLSEVLARAKQEEENLYSTRVNINSASEASENVARTVMFNPEEDFAKIPVINNRIKLSEIQKRLVRSLVDNYNLINRNTENFIPIPNDFSGKTFDFLYREGVLKLDMKVPESVTFDHTEMKYWIEDYWRLNQEVELKDLKVPTTKIKVDAQKKRNFEANKSKSEFVDKILELKKKVRLIEHNIAKNKELIKVLERNLANAESMYSSSIGLLKAQINSITPGQQNYYKNVIELDDKVKKLESIRSRKISDTKMEILNAESEVSLLEAELKPISRDFYSEISKYSKLHSDKK